MATVRYRVYQCSEGWGTQAGTVSGGGLKDIPNCNPGKGSWVELEYIQPFDPSQLNPADLGATFAVGFVVVATAVLISIPVRVIVRAVKDFWN